MCRQVLISAWVGMAHSSLPKKATRGRPSPLDELVDDADLVVQHPEPEQGGDDVGHQVGQQQCAADEGGLRHPVHQERQAQGEGGLEHDVDEDVLAGDGQCVPEQRVLGDRLVVVERRSIPGLRGCCTR